LLTIGGTISSGCSRTVGVWGAYRISSNNSVRRTTAPGVAAMLTPISNPSRSTLAGSRGDEAMSRAKLRAPRARLAPRCSPVARSAAGLVSR
jgi:hypothetical protein